MNLHRRQLTKEQKKEIADGLYEKGWGYGRIAKILKVGKSTIQDWVKGKRYESVPQQNSDNSPSPTQNPEQHGFSQGEDFEVFNEIVKNPQGGYSLGLRSKERRGGVLAADQRKTPQNAADRRGGSGPGHEAQGVLEPQAVVLL